MHFPIALLVTYGVCELIRFKRISTRPFWFYFKAILVIIGSIASLGAFFSGGIIEKMFRDIPEKNIIVPVHEMWAIITIIIFGILAASYFIKWVYLDEHEDFLNHHERVKNFWRIIAPFSKWVVETRASIILASLGLMSIITTGALGGAMVHGTKSDPLIAFFYNLFFK